VVKLAAKAGGRGRRLMLPDGANDLNAFFRDGGDVLAWLETEWERFGWDWPLVGSM
jgi:hypothetical protein